MNKIIVLDSYRTERRRITPLPERLPLAMSAHPSGVCLVIADREVWMSPAQGREVSAELARLSSEVESISSTEVPRG